MSYISSSMPDLIPEISGGVIVLIGSFNPRIFQPEWFARQQLLPQTETDKAEIKVIVPQFSHFETDRFIIQVTEDKFLAATKPNTNQAPLKDLVLGTFFILEHTPVTAMGLNCAMHFKMNSHESWHQIGDRLAPKEGWKGVLAGRPGMRSLTISTYLDEPKGAQVVVKVEPSLQVAPGVYFETNEHFQGAEKDSLAGLMDTLERRWEESQIYASRIANHVIAWATKPD